MRNRFDQIGKSIGEKALVPSGLTVIQDEISRDAQHADLRHEPDPEREAERALLGLLGRVAASVCLIEIYGHAPSAAEVRACLGKYVAFWEQRERNARARKRKAPQTEPIAEPLLWIIAAGCPAGVLAALRFTRGRGWPRGCYFFGGDVLRVGVIVASELPRRRSTLLVRLMAGGPLLGPAIAELGALPPEAHERAVAQDILLHFQNVIGQKPSRTPEEQEFIVTMYTSWEDARVEGRLVGARSALRRVLAARKLTPGRADEARIDACTDVATLERWIDAAATATSVAEALPRGASPARARGRAARPKVERV
jgi:hypothetical protein